MSHENHILFRLGPIKECSPAPGGLTIKFYFPMLVLGLCEPDAAQIIGLVCPSLVAYPDAMATAVAIFNRRRPHVSGYFRKRRFFFLAFSFQFTFIRRFQAPKTAGFLKRSPEWSYLLKKAGLSFSLRGVPWTDENGCFWIRWCHTSYSACSVRDDTVVPFYWPFRVDQPKRFEFAACRNRRAFFWKRRIKSPL